MKVAKGRLGEVGDEGFRLHTGLVGHSAGVQTTVARLGSRSTGRPYWTDLMAR